MAAPAKKIIPKQSLFLHEKTGSMIEMVENRQTEELIIGVCGSVGSGTSTISDRLEEIFSEFKYKVKRIKISDLIDQHLNHIKEELRADDFLKSKYINDIDFDKELKELSSEDRIALLQSAGNILRQKESADILAQLAIQDIALQRSKDESENNPDPEDEDLLSMESRRVVSIIDSLKNPAEEKLLRIVYGDMFYVFGVLCPERIRRERLISQKNIDATVATQLMTRDKAEGEKSGQQLLDTIFHSEFFITNVAENIDSLKPKLRRYVNLLMGDKRVTPTIEENAMFHAYSASVKSGCLSKQVGAAIIDQSGNLLSTGCNDVPRAKGGLYAYEDGDDDSRCMFKYSGQCINQKEKDIIFSDIQDILKKNLGNSPKLDLILGEIKKHKRLKSLIEFCRAIHAEMDAITSVARNGGVSLKGASLFSTTFPCHNCARHIIATGISKVFYIEPYEKSMALTLHKDAISFEPYSNEKNSKVEFIPFEGVSPSKYLKLFYAENRKKEGMRKKYNPKGAKPGIPVLLDTRKAYESKIVENLKNIGILKKSADK